MPSELNNLPCTMYQYCTRYPVHSRCFIQCEGTLGLNTNAAGYPRTLRLTRDGRAEICRVLYNSVHTQVSGRLSEIQSSGYSQGGKVYFIFTNRNSSIEVEFSR